MSTGYEFVRADTPLGEISALFQHSTLVDFPVVNEADSLKGIIPLSDIKPVVFDDDLYTLLIADDMMSVDPPVHRSRRAAGRGPVTFGGGGCVDATGRRRQREHEANRRLDASGFDGPLPSRGSARERGELRRLPSQSIIQLIIATVCPIFQVSSTNTTHT